MKIELSNLEVARISKPVKGRGGFQSLLRRIQNQIHGNILEASDGDIEKLVRYSFHYGQGGFQEQVKATARKNRR
jgi:hypothetical protein